MAAANLAIDIEAGATFNKVLTWYQEDGITPIVLTGCTAKAQFRKDIDDATVLLELSTENNRIVIDSLLGKITLHLTAIETNAITFQSAVYDLEIYFAEQSGEVYTYRLTKGKVKVSKQVTRV